MQYVTPNREVLHAENLRQLAEKLWRSEYYQEPTIVEWMASSAREAVEINGSVLRTSSPEDHVEDLIRAGFITRIEEHRL